MAGIVNGKVAIVTGAGRGVGREIAIALAAEGAAVVVNDVGGGLDGAGGDMTPAAEVVGVIEKAGGRAVTDGHSVAEWESAQAIVRAALDTYGRIDIVVNCAGILRDKIFHQLAVEDWDAVMKVHLYGSFYMSRAAAPHFRKQESGAYLHMTSTAGLIGSFGQANYSAAKMGIVGLSRAISFDMARFGVRSNCMAPAAFSRMIETIPGKTPEEQEAFMEIRRTRMRADQIAPLAVFMVSDAASEVNGQIVGARGNEVYLYNQPRPIRTLHRDGGWSAAALAVQLLPAWRSSLTPAERTREVIGWDPV